MDFGFLHEQKQKYSATIKSICDTAEREKRSFTAAEDQDIQRLKHKIDAVDATLAAVERQRELESFTFAGVGQPLVPAGAPVRRALDSNAGLGVARLAIALAAGKGSRHDALSYAEKRFGNDSSVMKALEASSMASGGALVPEEFARSFIEFLRPSSVVRRIGAQSIPLNAGNLTIPKLTVGGTAGYFAENGRVPYTEQQFSQLRMSARKLGALVGLSNDLLRYSSPSADSIVRADLAAAVGEAEDRAFLYGDSSEGQPRGIRNWADPGAVESANVTVNLANVRVDLGKLRRAAMESHIPGTWVWLMSPRTLVFLQDLAHSDGQLAFPELSTGMLRGFRVEVSSHIPNDISTDESEVFLVNPAQILIGDGDLSLDTSGEATYYDGDGNPQSAFGLDQTAVRVIMRHDLVVRHAAAIQVLDSVRWGV